MRHASFHHPGNCRQAYEAARYCYCQWCIGKIAWYARELSWLFDTTNMCAGRVLRYLASINTIEEVGQDTFEANHITRTLSQPGIEGGVRLS